MKIRISVVKVAINKEPMLESAFGCKFTEPCFSKAVAVKLLQTTR